MPGRKSWQGERKATSSLLSAELGEKLEVTKSNTKHKAQRR